MCARMRKSGNQILITVISIGLIKRALSPNFFITIRPGWQIGTEIFSRRKFQSALYSKM